MQLGTSPLRLVRNVVRCSCCGEALPGYAAGCALAAAYDGPHLVRVSIIGNGAEVVHRCPNDLPEPAGCADEPTDDPGDF